MFTGIITATGRIKDVAPDGSHLRYVFDAGNLDLRDAQIGESIAVSGACLTVVALTATGFAADISPETAACTTFGKLHAGARVNFERALRLDGRLGGHLVTGHIDGVGTVESCERDSAGARIAIALPAELARFVARKGSVCVDGVSLTVNDVARESFSVQIIPHTLATTTIGDYVAGTRVNIEVDLLARHIERLLETAGDKTGSNIDEDLLRRCGFI